MKNIKKTKIALGFTILALISMFFFDLPRLWTFLILALFLVFIFFVIPSQKQRLERLHRKNWAVKNAPK